MVKIKAPGKWKNTRKFLEKVGQNDVHEILKKYAEAGALALSKNTPVDTGKTAQSWGYELTTARGYAEILWTNTNIINGVNIAVILQYGHATNNGGYVQGRDYINPAIQPYFDKIANEAWEEITSL